MMDVTAQQTGVARGHVTRRLLLQIFFSAGNANLMARPPHAAQGPPVSLVSASTPDDAATAPQFHRLRNTIANTTLPVQHPPTACLYHRRDPATAETNLTRDNH